MHQQLVNLHSHKTRTNVADTERGAHENIFERYLKYREKISRNRATKFCAEAIVVWAARLSSRQLRHICSGCKKSMPLLVRFGSIYYYTFTLRLST